MDAAQTLIKLSNTLDRITLELLELLEDKNDDSEIRLSSAQILIKLGNILGEVQVGLLVLLEDLRVSLDADKALVKSAHTSERLGLELFSLLEDKTDEPNLRLSAAQILIKLSNISVIRLKRGLLALLENKNEGFEIRSSVAQVLDDLGKTSATSSEEMHNPYRNPIKDAIARQ